MITPVILREFRFSRDFRQIEWRYTLWYNLLRAACAGLVLAVLMLAFPQHPGDRAVALTAPFVWPIAYLCIFVPLGILLSLVQELPFVGLFSAFCALISVAAGDPIVCLIHWIEPRAVPVQAPTLFSLTLVFWVLDVPEIPVAGDLCRFRLIPNTHSD